MQLFTSMKVLKFWDRVLRPRDFDAPATVELDLTDRCNHHCPACTDTPIRTGGQLSLKDIEQLCQLNDLRSVVLKGGGEPTMHPELAKVIQLFAKANVKVGLETNGTLVRGLLATTIAQGCDWIRFSIDATTPKSYRRIHGVEGLNQVVDNVAELARLRKSLETRVTVGVGFIIFPFNLGDLRSSAELFERAGADYVSYRFATGLRYDRRTLNRVRAILIRCSLERARHSSGCRPDITSSSSGSPCLASVATTSATASVPLT